MDLVEHEVEGQLVEHEVEGQLVEHEVESQLVEHEVEGQMLVFWWINRHFDGEYNKMETFYCRFDFRTIAENCLVVGASGHTVMGL